MKLFKTFFIILIFIISGLYSESTVPVLSDIEKKSIEYIFDYLFKFDTFSYTLFSDKPLSFEHISTVNIEDISLRNYCVLFSYKKPINFLGKSWNVWQSKYSNIKFNNYYFFGKKNPKYTTIILINKRAFSKAFGQNNKLFKQILGEDIDEEKLLNRIMSDSLSLSEALNNHEGLLGILLGFGTHNSLLFQLKHELLKPKNKIIDPQINRVNVSQINKRMNVSGGGFNWVNIIQPVRFMAENSHLETRKLRNKYFAANTQISKIYKNQNFVDAIIIKLNE